MARGFGSTLGVGTTDVLQTSPQINDSTVRSISFWYNRNGAGGLNFGHAFETSACIMFWNSASSRISFNRKTSGTAEGWTLTGGTVNSTGTWNHIAIIFDSAIARGTAPVIYINGQAATVTTAGAGSGTINAAPTAWYLGNTTAVDRIWDGLLEDFAVYSRPLTQAQARALWQGEDPRTVAPGSLREYVPMRENRPVSLKTGKLAAITGTRNRRGKWLAEFLPGSRHLFATVASGGVTGTLAANDGADTAALAGDVIVQGSLAATEAGDTAALAGDVVVQGTLAATESADTAALAGDVLVQGALAATEAQDVAALTGSALIATGTLEATEAPDTAAFATAAPIVNLHARQKRRPRGRLITFPDELPPEPIVEVAKPPLVLAKEVARLSKEAGSRLKALEKAESERKATEAHTRKVDALRASYGEAVKEYREAAAAEDAWMRRLRDEDDFLLLAA